MIFLWIHNQLIRSLARQYSHFHAQPSEMDMEASSAIMVYSYHLFFFWCLLGFWSTVLFWWFFWRLWSPLITCEIFDGSYLMFCIELFLVFIPLTYKWEKVGVEKQKKVTSGPIQKWIFYWFCGVFASKIQKIRAFGSICSTSFLFYIGVHGLGWKVESHWKWR